MVTTSLSFLANHPLPFEAGTIGVSSDGTPRSLERAALRFRFEYSGMTVDAQVDPTADGACLSLDAVVAPMPFSAEGRARRREVAAIVEASRTGLHHGRFTLDPERRIHLASQLTVASPVTPSALIAAATRLLVAATPWLVVLRSHLGPAAPLTDPAA